MWQRLTLFWMDVHEVTNAQFAAFVEATGYVTTAEKAVDWEEIKKELPPGTPKPDASQLAPASLVFVPTYKPVSLRDVSQWWQWRQGANWRQPEGPGSNIVGKENHPVVHVSWFDAVAYCVWAGKRLPTEAEWEYASRGGLKDAVYAWGNEDLRSGTSKANTWEGAFPYRNDQSDGFYTTAPVQSYQANKYGLYDMAGNVWEWCADLYHEDYYKTLANKTTHNPQGPKTSYDSNEPYALKRVTRGGQFLMPRQLLQRIPKQYADENYARHGKHPYRVQNGGVGTLTCERKDYLVILTKLRFENPTKKNAQASLAFFYYVTYS